MNMRMCDSASELFMTLGILCMGKGLKLSDKQVFSHQINIPKYVVSLHRSTLETAFNLHTIK